MRLRADKNIPIYNQKLQRRAQIQSDIEPRRNGTYTVTLAFNDDDDQPILKMELMVPKEVKMCIRDSPCIGNKIRDRHVRLVSDGGDDRKIGFVDRTRHALVVERP